MNTKRDERKNLIYKLRINKSVVQEMQNTKFYALTLTLVILVAIFSLPPTFSSLMRNVTVRSSGTIGFIRPLHVEGKYIKNDLGQTVFLRGVNKHGFEDHPEGHWQAPNGAISWNSFDPAIVGANLDAMQSWGINFIRAYSTAQFWIDNEGNHRQIVKDLATMASRRGIYLMYSFWHVTSEAGMPEVPWVQGSSYIQSPAEFVEMWRNIATELKNYPNVMFELWNEPHGPYINEWFNASQECIDAIRSVGSEQIIVIQWDYGIYANLQYNNGATMRWVWEHPLNDPLGNLVYSTHIYRGDCQRETYPNWILAWTYDEMVEAFQICKLDYVMNTLNKPVLMGEIGPDYHPDGHGLEWYNNSLAVLNDLEMGYACFWWFPQGSWAHLTGGSNYQPNEAGQILMDAINAGGTEGP